MKLYIYALALLITLNSFAMQQEASFDFSAYLKEHKWHERLATLSPEQRGKLASFFGKQETGSGEDMPRAELAPVITQAMDYAEGKDILHLSVLDDSSEGIKRAVVMGADTTEERDGKSPLLWATLLRKINAVEGLLDCGVKADRVHVQNAISFNDIDLAFLLIKKSDLPIDQGYKLPNNRFYKRVGGNRTSLFPFIAHAVLEKNFPVAIELVNQGASIGTFSCDGVMSYVVEPFDAASKLHLLALLFFEQLLDKGYPTNRVWNYMSEKAKDVPQDLDIFYRNAKIQQDTWQNIYTSAVIKILLAKGADPNYLIRLRHTDAFSQEWRPLFRAIMLDKKEEVEVLLDGGADINLKAKPVRGKEYITPLRFAIDIGRSNIVELLMLRGAKL